MQSSPDRPRSAATTVSAIFPCWAHGGDTAPECRSFRHLTTPPRAAGVSNPFILEFPIQGSDLWFITNHRRIREHRRLTLLLNLLLAGSASLPPSQSAESFWAH